MSHTTKSVKPTAKAHKNDSGSVIERAFLAMRILGNANITLATEHVSGKKDSANARANAVYSLFLFNANRSGYDKAPGGDVALSVPLMRGMLALAENYRFRVSEIAGGAHSKNSRHYAGVAMDVDQINSERVSAKNKHVQGFMKQCKELGATELLGPGKPNHDTHVHAGWPRSS
jgi:zinc D-Ala-D-Ala carboxypeptidase